MLRRAPQRAHPLRQQHHPSERRGRGVPHFRARLFRRTGPLAPRPTSMMRTACVAWCSRPKRWRKVQQPDPDLLPMPTPEEVAVKCGGGRSMRWPVATSTAPLGSPRRIAPQRVSRMVDVAKRHGLTAAGIFSSAEVAKASSIRRGVSDWYEQTLAEVSVTMLDNSSSGWQKANSPDVDAARSRAAGGNCRQKAIESRNPRDLPPGKYTVILEPAAVLDIVGFMFWDFGGSALLEQRSFLNDRIGTQLFGDNITVWDDVYHPLQTGLPFDGEGMKRHRLKLIDNGVVQTGDLLRAPAPSASPTPRWPARSDRLLPRAMALRCPTKSARRPLNIVFAGPRHGRAPTAGADDRLHRARHSGDALVVYPRGRSLREDSYRHDARRHVSGGERQGASAAVRNFRFNESLLAHVAKRGSHGEPVAPAAKSPWTWWCRHEGSRVQLHGDHEVLG